MLKFYVLDSSKNVVISENNTPGGSEIIKVTTLKKYNYFISTAFLSLDFSTDDAGPPVVFETVCYIKPINQLIHLKRYSTYRDAIIGHRRAVRMMIAKIREGQRNQYAGHQERADRVY